MDEEAHGPMNRPADESVERAVSSSDLPAIKRRRLLSAIGGAGTVVLAGCLGDLDQEAVSYLVVFHEGGKRFEVEVSEDDKLLYPALEAGVNIPYSCEAGRCGQCTVKYDGNANDVVTHEGNEYLTEEQIRDGWLLTCVAYPTAESELEVAHPEDE